MKMYMASFTKFMICKNTWKFVRICKFEWWKLLIEEGYLNLKICTIYNVTNTSSFMPFDMKRCNAFMKEYHLKNVQKPKEKLHWFAGNRFQHRKNPILSERYNSEFKKYHAGTGSPIGTTRFLVQNPEPCFLRNARTRFPVREEPVPKGSFSKIHFERYFKQSFSWC